MGKQKESKNKKNQHPLVEKNNKENQLKNLSKVLKKQEKTCFFR